MSNVRYSGSLHLMIWVRTQPASPTFKEILRCSILRLPLVELHCWQMQECVATEAISSIALTLITHFIPVLSSLTAMNGWRDKAQANMTG